MNAIKLTLFSLTAGLAFSITASASSFYVATSGADSNPGSQTQPWRTVQHAVDTIATGDTIIVQAGTYAGCRIGKSGSLGAVCTLRAQSPGAVIINSLSPSNRHQSLIEIENFDATTSYWVIDGFELAAAQRYGIDLRNTDFITVQNCTAHNSGLTGIFSAFSYHPLIQNNESYSNGEHGIYQSNSGDSPTIRGNKLHNNAAAGLHMNGDRNFTPGDGIISFAVVEKNIIWENGTQGGSGINCDGVSDSIIRNNLLYNNHSSGISLYAIDGAEGSSRNRVYNNTIVMAPDGRWCINIPASSEGQPNPTGNDVKNNILYTPHTFRGSVSIYSNAVAGFASDYNIVVNRFSIDGANTSMSLSQWQALGHDQHSIVATPSQLFSNASANDYTLKAGSLAIDAGTPLGSDVSDDLIATPRPQQSGYDMGCYEVAGGAPPPLVADFSGGPLSGITPLPVQFIDLSTGGATSWLWLFGDGAFSTARNPVHTYQTGGSFTVSLTASNSSGPNTRTRTDYIVVIAAVLLPVVDFTASPLNGNAPLTVQFTDQSIGATSWLWDFGDGTTSSLRNTSHTYQGAGSYWVSLRGMNSVGMDTKVAPDYVTVQRPSPRDFNCVSAVMENGKLVRGDHTGTHLSDDAYLVVKSVALDGKFGDKLVYTFETGLTSINGLIVTTEARANLAPQRQQVFLFNFSTGVWEMADERMMGSTEDIVSFDVSSPSRYLSSNGQIRLRIRTGDLETGFRWKHFVDLVKITAQP